MLSLLTDDVERWEVGAPTRVRGKQPFAKNMVWGPQVTKMESEVARIIEDGDVAMSEGMVRLSLKDGKTLNIRFLDVFEFDGDRIKKMTCWTYDGAIPA